MLIIFHIPVHHLYVFFREMSQKKMFVHFLSWVISLFAVKFLTYSGYGSLVRCIVCVAFFNMIFATGILLEVFELLLHSLFFLNWEFCF